MTPPHSPNLFLYFALPCEAKPVIDKFKLKKNVNIHCFAVYSNDNLCLTVTGIGKAAMAAGIAYTQALFPSSNHPIMLNIGIAGHQTHSIGSVFLLDKITDNDTGRRFYPPLAFNPPCPTYRLITVSKPQTDYPNEALCDMEASAFYETATRFTTSELIQSVKFVSDNRSSPAQNIQPKMVSELIDARLSVIEGTLSELSKLANIIPEPRPPEFETLLSQYHFTGNEQIQLKKLLLRRRLILGENNIDIEAKTGSEYLKALKLSLDQTEFYL